MTSPDLTPAPAEGGTGSIRPLPAVLTIIAHLVGGVLCADVHTTICVFMKAATSMIKQGDGRRDALRAEVRASCHGAAVGTVIMGPGLGTSVGAKVGAGPKACSARRKRKSQNNSRIIRSICYELAGRALQD